MPSHPAPCPGQGHHGSCVSTDTSGAPEGAKSKMMRAGNGGSKRTFLIPREFPTLQFPCPASALQAAPSLPLCSQWLKKEAVLIPDNQCGVAAQPLTCLGNAREPAGPDQARKPRGEGSRWLEVPHAGRAAVLLLSGRGSSSCGSSHHHQQQAR